MIGQILMFIAAREIQSEERSLVTFPMKLALAYTALVFIPVAGWFFYHATAWSTVYLKPEDSIPWWAGPGFLLTYFTGMVLGAGSAQLLIQRGFKWAVPATFVLGVLWLVVTWAFTYEQYIHVGTFADYHAGRAGLLFDDKDFQMKLNVAGVIMFVPAAGIGYWLFTRSRELGKKWF